MESTEARKLPVKKPPARPIQSLQYDLFSQFVANDPDLVSNSIEFWESIPKYFFTPKQVEKLRTETGHADPFEWKYSHNNKEYVVKIHPALIQQNDSSYKAFFPGENESAMEEILKKIFTEQGSGIHDPDKSESWVKFSYSMIRRELYKIGNSLRYDQIKHALEVMSKCILNIFENGIEVYTGTILQDYCKVNRQKYLSNTESLHVARFPIFLSHAVNTLQYRQYNYQRLMSCSEQLSRYLYWRMIHRFRQASILNNYHFLYSDIKQASGLLQQKREVDNRRKAKSALEELVARGILLKYEIVEQKKGRKVTDAKYTVYPTPEFVSEQKAANRRKKETELVASNVGLFVDK